MGIGDEKISEFLDRVAGRAPAPGAGAAAALHAAMGAALLGMVARYITGERHAEHQETVGHIVSKTDEMRGIAFRLAEADAAAFAAVSDAVKMPAATDSERAGRAAAISRALVNAAWPARKVISLAGLMIDIAEALATLANRNLVSEVAAGAEAARAAAAIALVTVEISLADIADEQTSLEMIAETAHAGDIIARADRLTAALREQIRGR